MNSRAIFPDSLAQFCAARAGENTGRTTASKESFSSTPGAATACELRTPGWNLSNFDASACLIVGATFAYTIEDAQYPKEWQYAQDGQPCCTAFVRVGEAIPAHRCERTRDLFDRDAS